MILKIFKKPFKSKLSAFIVLSLVFIAGYSVYYLVGQGEETARYALATVERGTLIVSVSGSGQVSAADQINIVPKVSGELTALYITKDQAVKSGQLLAVLDSSEAERSVRDAQNTLNDAEYSLVQAQKDYLDIEKEANRTLTDAYQDGYDAASTAFFKLSDYMADLKDTLGTEKSPQEYITGYELVLGSDSAFTQKLIDDYEEANDVFNENFAFFRTVSRDDASSIISQLIADTLATSKTISRALDSARHMFDAVALYDYEKINIVTAQVNAMQPSIQSDVSAISSVISSLQAVKDTIDDTNENTPGKIEIAARAIQTAQNTVLKKEEALTDAQKELAKYSICAPFGGIITLLGDTQKGDTISANTILATLITRQKIAEITLNESDVANVKVGQNVTVSFDALENMTVAGKVIEVDSVGTESQGVVSYGVVISLDTNNELVKIGMSLTADIITQSKQDVLILQNSAVKSQDGKTYYVQVVDEQEPVEALASASGIVLNKLPIIQEIQIGIADDTNTEIISGLKEGDIVILKTVKSNSSVVKSSSSSNESNSILNTVSGSASRSTLPAGGPPGM
jgi:HlyD family secretion protein